VLLNKIQAILHKKGLLKLKQTSNGGKEEHEKETNNFEKD